MDGTIIQQGRFTSTGLPQTLIIRSDVDWIEVLNETATIQQTADLGSSYFFQRGMTPGRGFVTTLLGAQALDPLTKGQIFADGGFTFVDSTTGLLGAAIATTGSTNVVRPIVSTGATAGVVAGGIVRLLTGPSNLSGYDMSVDTIVTDTTFRVAGALATAPGVGLAGTYRIVNFEPIFYPRQRFIFNITAAVNCVITTSIPSGYTVGQAVKIHVPATTTALGVSIYGMTEIDDLVGTVTAVNNTLATQTVTLDIDTTAFTAFTFPTVAQATGLNRQYAKAYIEPFGSDTGQALTAGADILGDATRNTGFLGVRLGIGNPASPGVSGPSGQNNDVMYWRAGKSFSVTNL